IDLRQKLSAPVPTTLESTDRKAITDTKKSRNTATLVSIETLDILIPNNRIVEIFNVQSVTKVPNAPKGVVGTINFRGKVISAFDLTEILLPDSTCKDKTKKYQQDIQAIILEVVDQQIAIIVDEFREIVELIETDLRLAVVSANEDNPSYYFQGVMLDRSGFIILVLNVNFLFQVLSNLTTLDHQITKAIFFKNPSDEVEKQTITQTELDENALVLITLLGDTYALKSSSVIEILQTMTITPVANSAPYFVGSTTFRGDVVPVIDLQSFFYSEYSLNDDISEDHWSYLVVEHLGKTVIFQVESILGSISMPEESQTTSLKNLKVSEKASFYSTGFLYNNRIVVQLNHQEILRCVVSELEQVQAQFIVENQTLIVPIVPSEVSEEFNIHLHQKVSTQKSITKINPVDVVKSSQDVIPKGTLASIGNLNILVPNKYIKEIFNITRITQVPNVPEAIIGSVNYRGNVIPVLHLSEVLVPKSAFPSKAINEVLILEVKGENIALHVDRISSIIDIEKTALRPILEFADGKAPQHFIQGAMITDQIVLILNVEFLFQVATNPSLLEQESSQLLFFKNPVKELFRRTHEAKKREGLLFESDGYTYFLNSKYVIQVIEEDSYLLKDYPQAIVKGAAIHTDIVPLIDFNFVLKEKNQNQLDSKSVGILINEPKSNIEFVLLVNNIKSKITISDCEIFQNFLGISRKILPPIVSGFFSYQGMLGMIINPDSLFKKIKILVQESLTLKDIKEEFPTTLSPEELKFLEDIKSKRKDLELLLFYRHEGTRLDLFVFKIQEYVVSVDVTHVRKVFSSVEWKKIDSKFYPIIGTAIIDEVTYPIIDLSTLIFKSQNQTEFQRNIFLFLLEIGDLSFLIPATDIEGVVTKFKEELTPCEEVDIFLGEKRTCQYMFSYENISSSIYIIENKFLKESISKKDVKNLLKEVENELKEKE
ncbi:MAG: chemotaxis protein CheW, partial [Promethearchaeota archaeon]